MSGQWKYVDEKRDVVIRTLDNGDVESCFTTSEQIQNFIKDGGKIEENN